MYYRYSTLVLIIFMLLFIIGIIFIVNNNINSLEKFQNNYDMSIVRLFPPVGGNLTINTNNIDISAKDNTGLSILTSESMFTDNNDLYYISSSYRQNNGVQISNLFRGNSATNVTLSKSNSPSQNIKTSDGTIKGNYIIYTYSTRLKIVGFNITFNDAANNYSNKIKLFRSSYNANFSIDLIKLDMDQTIIDKTLKLWIKENTDPYEVDKIIIFFDDSIADVVVKNIEIRGIPINLANKVELDPVEPYQTNNMLGENNGLPIITPNQKIADEYSYKGTSPNKKFKELVQIKKPYAMYYAGNVGFKEAANNVTQFQDLYGRQCRNAVIIGDYNKIIENISNKNAEYNSNKIAYIKGDVKTQIIFPYDSIPREYTICAITKYTNTNRNRARILSADTNGVTGPNWLLGHWGGRTLIAHHNGWLSRHNNINNKTEWVISCATSGTNGSKSYVFMNDEVYEHNYRPIGNYNDKTYGTLTINKNPWGENSDFALSYVIIWDVALQRPELINVYDALENFLNTGEELDYATSQDLGVTVQQSKGSCGNPGLSAKDIKDATGTNTDGVYWIYISNEIGVKPVYCIMNSACYGGGWMLAIKGAKDKTTFMYNSGHWTNDTVLNENFLRRNNNDINEDAKYHVFNGCKINDCLAIFNSADVKGISNLSGYGYAWYEPNIIKVKQTLLNYFKNDTCYINYFGDKAADFSHFNRCEINNRDKYKYTNDSDKNNARNRFIEDHITNKYKEGIWSNQKEFMAYGLNIRPRTWWGHSVRWGGTFNENPGTTNYGYWWMGDGSNDVSGGIGITAKYSCGDYISCCESSKGTAASMRFEWYVR